MASLYSYVQDTVQDLDINDLTTVDVPDKLKAFRKFLSEISKQQHKKFTTKIVNNKLHIMRINYHSVTEIINP